MVRIRDVAKQLNLSITTVSRALDGYTDVAEQTRQLVVHTAQEMGYTPNRAARQLRRQHAETIGFILPVETIQLSDPFFSEFIAGIGDEATACNYDLLVSAAPPGTNAEIAAYHRWVQAGKVDGVIIARTRVYDSRVEYLLKQNTPFVCMERSLYSTDFIGVEVDSYSSFLQLMEHLITLGHDRIAYIGGCPKLKIDADRLAAYQAGLACAGLSFDPDLVIHGDLTLTGGYTTTECLLNLQFPPTAIMCINDLTAIGAMHAVSHRGLRVGHDVSISGFDGLADSAHSQPPLTTIEQPVYSVARQLVKILLAQIVGDELCEKHIRIQPKVLIRSSTGARL
jgi:LacI family transcriptional regulator